MNHGKWREKKICGVNDTTKEVKETVEGKGKDIQEMSFPQSISSWKKEQGGLQVDQHGDQNDVEEDKMRD